MASTLRCTPHAALAMLVGAICLPPTPLRGAETSGAEPPAGTRSSLVAAGARVERVAGGFRFTEGPAWSEELGLLFSDIPSSRILRVLPDGTVTSFLEPSGGANGLMFDARGQLVACQMQARRMVRIDPATRAVTILADRYDGKPLNSPNDLAIDAQGGIYFTDPRYGRGAGPVEQPVMGVYHISPSGRIRRVISDLKRPNGILVSPDGERLYVADPDRLQVHEYPILGPGTLGPGRLFFTGDPKSDRSGPDGMAHDARGNLWATYAGLVVIGRDGQVIERIAVPETPSNCTFGGEGGRTLFITARTGLYALRTRVAGASLPSAAAASTGGGTRPVRLRALRLDIPAAWKRKETRRPFRLAEFTVPGAGDAAAGELVVFHFGSGGAGSEAANVQRWIRQLEPDERKVSVRTGRSPQGKYTIVDLSGTYREAIGPPVRREYRRRAGYRVVDVVLHRDDGDYFLKLVGPRATVSAAMAGLRRSFEAKESEEKELDVPPEAGR